MYIAQPRSGAKVAPGTNVVRPSASVSQSGQQALPGELGRRDGSGVYGRKGREGMVGRRKEEGRQEGRKEGVFLLT